MSESELSTPANIPADIEIEQCLRRVVRDALKADEDITTNLARTRAEGELGLDTGFLKDNAEWKKKSKDIINTAVQEPESPEKPKKAPAKPKTKPAPKAGTKRKSDEAQPKKKRQKKSVTPESVDDVAEDEPEPPKPKSKKNGVQPKKPASKSEQPEEPEPSEEDQGAHPKSAGEDTELEDAKSNSKPAADADDESELSSVLDDPPPKKKRQKKSSSPSETKGKASKTAAKPAKVTKELSPNDEEIKGLQGWLAKCGVRKVWGKELKKFDTSKEKIKHLKSLLEDVGMTGRYSAEKANQIKEARELAADIEAAKEFNEQWGQKKGSGDDEEGSEDEEQTKEEARPQRRRPKGLVDFGDSGDEDSD